MNVWVVGYTQCEKGEVFVELQDYVYGIYSSEEKAIEVRDALECRYNRNISKIYIQECELDAVSKEIEEDMEFLRKLGGNK